MITLLLKCKSCQNIWQLFLFNSIINKKKTTNKIMNQYILFNNYSIKLNALYQYLDKEIKIN